MIIQSQEKYRPLYHFTPQQGWINDPNGLVYFNDEYHLFFQYHPDGTTWGPMHWGHAISSDLVNWQEQSIALAPDEYGTIFSGSAVVDWHDSTGFFGGQAGLVAIFTHHDHNHELDRAQQRQSLAYSLDAGRTWIKYQGNPVLEHKELIDFRDPKVFWHQATEQWIMILACGQTVHLYRSPNLKEWTFLSEFGEGIGSHDGVWECPDLFPLVVDGQSAITKWVMLVSIGSSDEYVEGSRTQYFIGDFDGTTFTPDASSYKVRWLDYGRDHYAGVCWSDIPAEDGRRICIGWMSNWKYANLTPTELWRGAMSLPRELTLEQRAQGITLIQQPVQELLPMRNTILSLEHVTIADIQSKLNTLQLESYEIHMTADIYSQFALKLRTSQHQATVVGYEGDKGEIYIDRTDSGDHHFHPDFAGKHIANVHQDQSVIELRIYVDRSSIELFANDGQVVITDLIFPDHDAQGLDIQSLGQDLPVASFHIYQLMPS
ncbi:fructan beta-fructosidase [Paenibacillus sp. SORGH_AS306]|uniref:glycoside hydrolase family 32 protein n=1 Tax=unclassified Paenibacillus TaxID=185978 RepID=UPI00277D32B9|nr:MULTISPECIES: glycoside hydrolase family 32 protein [unclassified Paenibacillus]MDQ1236149.1 fructan beta-fructosidase [Paenibacillus sp. SORGH_AS_0306]MDR6108504.1 fructan beta-fructosidase [Paenibacillus sp. SORGH_AS_0338]